MGQPVLRSAGETAIERGRWPQAEECYPESVTMREGDQRTRRYQNPEDKAAGEGLGTRMAETVKHKRESEHLSADATNEMPVNAITRRSL